MERNKQIANRLNEVLLNGLWIANTNYKLQIESITWQQATHKIGTLNTIASLTFHINYYLAGLINVFQGGGLDIRDQYSFDLPPIASETDWKRLKDEFLANSELFIREVENLKDSKLDEPFVDEKYGTYLRNIEGVIEHSYYHLGQISLIKKMIIEKDK
ncbi:putative damage-inducible protein DinB [Flavobacterium arsenatis]|uniref:Damage-inducible protein DinB n=1 Tax=Flavobacterium arsenatis TaxID=1484332 RepID=A0ABU1TLI8_9FLAO|nr:DinB family protein [Flavobacterium arsenatis]MDR6966839.1 putative damage-inducible protein DinB [Flavobacterium arsenatis]